MSALALLIDDSVREALRAIVRKATEEPTPYAVLQAVASGALQPETVSEGRTMVIPMGFQIVYTHEQHPKGILRHLSVSIVLEGRVPHPAAVQMIMEEVGFVLPLEKTYWWEEPCNPPGAPVQHAINVVEPLDGNWEPHLVQKKAGEQPPPAEEEFVHRSGSANLAKGRAWCTKARVARTTHKPEEVTCPECRSREDRKQASHA